MNPITLSEMSDESEEVKIISSYEPQDDEIAIVFDSSKITGGNALDFFQFTKHSHSNVKVYGDPNGVSYLQLNSITLGTFFATSIMVPFLVNLISNYIQKKIDNFGTRDIDVQVSIIKKAKSGKHVKYTVSGKVEDVLKVINKIK
ncbi:hypothetical protein [Klebsiella michiganensis]|uniref:hypothetical protein n=1 Tax=Klebsiella michiganensis TaxID=1134687 RepID=UPI0025919F06|nr:hypothetical protein [Klebsiella michiganensis]MDM4530332.1 hypothetical protein [Klebsiella michiganensis]MDM4541416.1 hypothetical protein [Klebsiella michiganensis]